MHDYSLKHKEKKRISPFIAKVFQKNTFRQKLICSLSHETVHFQTTFTFAAMNAGFGSWKRSSKAVTPSPPFPFPSNFFRCSGETGKLRGLFSCNRIGTNIQGHRYYSVFLITETIGDAKVRFLFKYS